VAIPYIHIIYNSWFRVIELTDQLNDKFTTAQRLKSKRPINAVLTYTSVANLLDPSRCAMRKRLTGA
jgi:hypothetical protein